MNKNIIVITSLTISALIAGGYLLFFSSDSNDMKIASLQREVETPSLDTTLLSEKKVDNLRPIEALKDPLASTSKAHVHGPNCNHGDDAVVATTPKPLNHDKLPEFFERLLLSDRDTGERSFLTNRDVFSSLRDAKVGDQVALELANDIALTGNIKALKTYPQDTSLLKGTVELRGIGGTVFFFQSSEKLNAHIVFDEKSIALVYGEGLAGSSFIATPISDLFCSSQGAVYPLDHPSNVKGFLQTSK